MNRFSRCVVLLAALVWAAPTEAAPVLNILPPTGLSAAPGETVGWGYEIVNDDADHWLMVGGLTADGFEFGTGSDLIFDFPIIAPGATWTRTYTAGVQGLYEFTWSATAPVGFVQSGVFHIAAELWSGDPLEGGEFFSSLPDFIAPYEVTVSAPTPPPTGVPEPTTLMMIGAGLAFAGLSRARPRRRQ